MVSHIDENSRRIQSIHKEIWIECPQARKKIEAILMLLQIPIRATAPCILIWGAGGSGKTTIVSQLKKVNKGLGSPFAFLSLVNNVSQLKFHDLILEALGIPLSLPHRRNVLPQDVVSYIKMQSIRVLVIDEFHESLTVSRSDQLRNLSLIKGLSGSPYHLSIVLLGTHSAKNALANDDQLARRYQFYELKGWELNDDFRNFLATLESFVDLKKPSGLHSEEMVRLIHLHSKGTMDRVVSIVKAAATYAIKSGEERITKELIERSALDLWGGY